LARNGHAEVVALCPFLGAERTSGNSAATSESDPERDIRRPSSQDAVSPPTVIELTVLGERASMSGLGCAGLNEPETARAYI